MKHNWEAGDEAVLIVGSAIYKGLRLANVEIEYVRDDGSYLLKHGVDVDRDQLYTSKEAIEFITNYINKGE